MSREANLNPVAVMGAGAVGCYYGGMLARAGHEVTLIARAQHVEAVRKNGLRLESKAFDERVAMRAAEEPSGARGAKLVLFSVSRPIRNAQAARSRRISTATRSCSACRTASTTR